MRWDSAVYTRQPHPDVYLKTDKQNETGKLSPASLPWGHKLGAAPCAAPCGMV